MSSGWIPGWPVDPIDGYGPLTPVAGTGHRTYGAWAGAYSTIKANGLAQVLIGRDSPRRVQFTSLFTVMYHCNGANFKAFGAEFEGENDDDPELTAWQEDSFAELLAYGDSIGVPRSYLDPFSEPPASVWVNGGGYHGWLSHYSVKTDDGSAQHTDLLTAHAFTAAGTPAPIPHVYPEDDDMLFVHSPHNPIEIWCLAGNTRRHITPDEWKMRTGPFGGNPANNGGAFNALTITAEWFDSYPVAA
jgi:hypothetical protein